MNWINEQGDFRSPCYLTFEQADSQYRPGSGIVSPARTPEARGLARRSTVDFSDGASPVSHGIYANRNEAENAEGSLDNVPGAFTFYIGPTGTSDAYLLRRQAFLENNCTSTVATGLKFRLTEKLTPGNTIKQPSDPTALPPTIFGITDHAIIESAEPSRQSKAVDRCLARTVDDSRARYCLATSPTLYPFH